MHDQVWCCGVLRRRVDRARSGGANDGKAIGPDVVGDRLGSEAGAGTGAQGSADTLKKMVLA